MGNATSVKATTTTTSRLPTATGKGGDGKRRQCLFVVEERWGEEVVGRVGVLVLPSDSVIFYNRITGSRGIPALCLV